MEVHQDKEDMVIKISIFLTLIFFGVHLYLYPAYLYPTFRTQVQQARASPRFEYMQFQISSSKPLHIQLIQI